MDERYMVAEGTYDDGLTWLVWARRHEPHHGDLLSMIRVNDASGRILHASGLSGPPLDPGHLLNVRTGGSEEGPRALLARVHPTVAQVTLLVQDGATIDVPVYDCPAIGEVRFASVLLPRDVRLESIAGLDAKGRELDRFDLRFQQGRWEQVTACSRAG